MKSPGSAQPASLALVVAAVAVNLLLLFAPMLLVTGHREHSFDARMGIFGLLVSAWCIVEGTVACNGTRCVRTMAGPRWLPLAIGFAMLMTFWISLADAGLSSRTPSFIAIAGGAVLMSTGIVLRYLAIHRLGTYFLNEVAVLPEQPLVTDGVYSVMRHPSETGTLCLAFGSAVLLNSLPGLIATVLVLLPCVVWRTRLEDRLLRGWYGNDFQRYARAVPALFPRMRQPGGYLAAAEARISQPGNCD